MHKFLYPVTIFSSLPKNVHVHLLFSPLDGKSNTIEQNLGL